MKKKYYIIVLFVVVIVIVIGSITMRQKTSSPVDHFYLPDDLFVMTFDYDKEFGGLEDELRLVVYLDSIHCSTCLINRMNTWLKVVEYIEEYNDKVSLIMVFSPPPRLIDNFMYELSHNPLDYPLFVDTGYHIQPLNEECINRFHSFIGLINKSDSVLVWGNPLIDKDVWNKYKITIDKY
ncbi:MAG: hypothetical protein IKJ66_02125 [Bacteroidaceae bacterium]|nr:hypothetical protein [Bacteroidaceae bacterium]